MNDTPLRSPSTERIAAANVTAFRAAAARRWGRELPDYDALYAWSIAQPEEFWTSIWEQGGVIGERGTRVLVGGDRMPGARCFPDARLNFAQNLLRSRDATDAIVFWGEDRVHNRLAHGELYRAVAHFAAALSDAGVKRGDRVAAYLPNMPETVIALLAAASIGATFTSASPDFDVPGVLDRFGQTAPVVLIACDGYFYAGKTLDCLAKLGEIVRRLPSVKRVVVVPYVQASPDLKGVPHARLWRDFIAPFHFVDDIEFAALPFDHPLYILYSSGTTGVPECLVHGAGGTLLQHLKEHRLHADVKPGDRLFYFTTCAWMTWNWLVSGLASGATLLLYDGSPFAADNQVLFDYADAERMTHFGASAQFLDAAAKFGLKPRGTHKLATVRVLMSTDSPLVAESFDYVYRDIEAVPNPRPDGCSNCMERGHPTSP